MKKIFIIVLLLSSVYAISSLDLGAILKNEFSYNTKIFVQTLIIISCLLLVLRLILQLLDPKKYNKSKIIKEDNKKEDNLEQVVSNVYDEAKEKIIQKRYKEGNKKRIKNLEIKREQNRIARELDQISKEGKELDRCIALEEKKRKKLLKPLKKPVIKRTAASKNTITKKKVVKKPIEKKKSPSVTLNTINRVNYITDRVITSTQQYPIIRKPQRSSIIRSYRLGRNNRKGYKEEELYHALKDYFYDDFEIIDNAMLAIGEGTNPYEPDIAMISKGTKNIHIDIEIDEPYAGVSRKLTHCYPEDTKRDNFFVDRGWLVIRFSEYQVHHQIEECLYEIAKVIAAIDINFRIGNLSSYKYIDKIKCWNTSQADLWQLINYRENYLNHSFKPYREPKRIIDTSLTLEEKLEERLVRPQTHHQIAKPRITNAPPKRKVYTEREEVKPSIPPPKREFNSNNSKVSDLIEMAIDGDFAIEMEYTNYKRESSIRKISKLEYTEEFLKNDYRYKEHFKGYCHNRLSERSFKITRISFIKILN